MHSSLTRIAAVLIASTMLAGVANAETIRWARSSDALTLDPHSQNQGNTHTLAHHIYETLIGRDNDGTLTPRLATEWALKEGDPTVWVFKLREGVKFHNGNDFTAEDVVYSIERAKSEFSNMKQLHAEVQSVSAVDDYTVEFQMTGPALIYPNNLTNTFIMDKTWSDEHDLATVQDFASGATNYAVLNTNGTGPYTLVSREVDVKTTLAYNDGWWGEKPEVTDIEYLTIADAQTRISALLSGEIDIVQDVPPQDIQRLSSTAGFKVETGPENRFIYFGSNPFNNPKVREAMELVLDRDAIKQVVMRGQSIPTGIPNPPFVRGWTEELDAYPAPDVEKAKALMAEAGYPNGFSVTLDTPNNRYVNDEAISTAYVGMLGQIGINVTLASRPVAEHSPIILANQSDFYLLGWGVPTFDSAYVFNDLIHSKTELHGTYNVGLYSNPELDEKIIALGTMDDMDARDALVNEIWEVVKADRVLLPIHNQVLAYAMREGVTLPVQPENQPNMTTVTFQ